MQILIMEVINVGVEPGIRLLVKLLICSDKSVIQLQIIKEFFCVGFFSCGSVYYKLFIYHPR